ncbi:hypothetical protein BRADI_4g19641v3 [Brachypodium distachyon]|uniref:Uncharacterized protein n=1 Tax=Brachypodium distachyon TaxID=15368 RepID=I1ILV7_BRADI|nr:hypothetical protein BRADI_4g19641v3 [Brachypodium distachyon]
MSPKKVDRASIVVLLLIVLSVCAAGGRELAEQKLQKDFYSAASKEGATVSSNHPRNLMVKTNDYGRYDPAPAFSKPRFKLIPN